MSENVSVKLAYHFPSSKVIHIVDADNGQSCNCECRECKEKLEAVQGQVRDWHFRHSINKNCKGAQESALHQLGKQILLDNNQLEIPRYGTINYSNPIAEMEFNSKRPDVTANYLEEKIYFEIAVNHFIEADKEEFFNSGSYKCVEIDLSNVNVTSLDEIKKEVLTSIDNKRLIGWKMEGVKQNSENRGAEKFVLITLVLLFFGWLFGRRK